MSDVERATYKSSGPDSGDYVRAERYDEIRALLVEACIEIMHHNEVHSNNEILAHLKKKYGVTLRLRRGLWVEDKAK